MSGCVVNVVDHASSGGAWTTAVITVVLGGVVTFGVKLLQDSISQWRETTTIAAALAGEISGYTTNLNPKDLHTSLIAVACADDEHLGPAAFDHMPTLPEGHPIFDKISGAQIGLLQSEAAREISAFYNMVTGVRLTFTHYKTEKFEAVPKTTKKASYATLALQIEPFIDKVDALIDYLNNIEATSYFSYCSARFKNIFGAKEKLF